MKFTPLTSPVRDEHGSAIVIILVVVALFGALSFTVGQMLRESNPQAISEEKSRLYAQEILAYAQALRQGVQNLRIGGCIDTGISFENDALPGYAHVPAASSSCRVYDPAGSAMAYTPPPADWLDSRQQAQTLYGKIYVTGHVCVPGSGGGEDDGCAADTTDNEELVLFIPYLRREVCAELSQLAGISEDGEDPPQEEGNAWPPAAPKFTGSYSDGTSLDQDGLMQGCFEGDDASTPGAETYHFFQVLAAR